MRLDLRLSLCAVLCGAFVSAAHAGGPLYIDQATMRPVAYPNATPVRVYTDLGKLGTLDSQAIGAQVANAFAQWTNVETADFEATIVGDFATIGLPDIVAQNAASIIGKDNGGGIHVIYDDDGSLLKNFLGADDSVLGMATPEFGVGPVVTESWVVLNGVPTAYGSSANYVGVVTHEAGHAIGLAHSQTNGESVGWHEEPGPYACAAPWSGRPSFATVETMHPTIRLWETGLPMGSVDMLDDRAALSNLYPAAGWPASGASIHGRILGLDGKTGLTGVNVIARNLDDPFADAISVISGDHTQGRAGPMDGSRSTDSRRAHAMSFSPTCSGVATIRRRRRSSITATTARNTGTRRNPATARSTRAARTRRWKSRLAPCAMPTSSSIAPNRNTCCVPCRCPASS